MATTFPTTLDILTNPGSGDTLNAPSHSTQHANSNDAIEALQAKVGVNSSAITTSLDYVVRNLPAANITSGTLPSARLAAITSLSLSTGSGAIIKSTEQRLVNGTNQSAGLYMGDSSSGNVATGGIEVSWNTGNTNPTIGIGVTRDSIGTKITMDYAGNLRFFSCGTEKLSITSSSAAFANTITAPAGNFSSSTIGTGVFSGSVTVQSQGIAYTGATSGGGTANLVGFRWSSPDIIGVIDNVTSCVVGTVSDRRFKTNIQPLVNGLATIKQLRPVTYNPLDVIGFDENKQIILGDKDPYDTVEGFIADEVEKVAPWLVKGGENGGYQSVNYALITPMLVQAIQALDQRLSELESV